MRTPKTLSELPLENKRVCLRVDYNVPFDESGTIIDDSRIRATLPTIKYLLEKGCGIVLMSHCGRPRGKKDPQFTLKRVASYLENLIGRSVKFIDSLTPVLPVENGEIVMLENLRFYPGEEKPESDPAFADRLAAWGEVYVNDAFAVSHRKHTSVYALAQKFAGRAAMGLLLERELQELGVVFNDPVRPFFAVIGGSKVSTKLGVIEALLKKVDGLMVGGGLAYTFLKARGVSVGNSLVEEDFVKKAEETLASAEARGVEFLLPIDLLVSRDVKAQEPAIAVDITEGVPDGAEGVSIGPKTVEAWGEKLKSVKTVFWNGPLGIYEMAPYQGPTLAFARKMSELSAFTLGGGGDCVAAIHKAGVADRFTYLSTGGGATLELLEYGSLPGVDALID